MKKIALTTILFLLGLSVFAQHTYTGKVFSSEGKEVAAGITVSQVSSGRFLAVSDERGVFRFKSDLSEISVRLSGVGYLTEERRLSAGADTVFFVLQPSSELLNEVVVSTGYEVIPKDRATGSFAHVSNEVLNRSVSTGILARLEGVTNSLQFDRRRFTMREMDAQPDLRVRGLSTINSDPSPLIVVDNFPFEGNIEQLNPNDVQDVVILKDAAAASIWGARAANGVIVITTKKGKLRQPLTVNVASTTTIRQRPDLWYDQRYLDSETMIEVERTLFDRGFYNSRLNNAGMTSLPVAVDILHQHRSGLISSQELERKLEQMKGVDYRNDASRFLYQEAIHQQHSINTAGGADKVAYRFSAGYDKNRTEMVGDDLTRMTFSSETTIRPSRIYELTMGLNYAMSLTRNNGISAESASGSLSPYLQLADEKGKALAIPRTHRLSYAEAAIDNGLLDWTYRPLDEIRLGNNSTSTAAFRFFGGLRLHLLKNLTIDLKYQYQNEKQNGRNIQYKETYYVRDLVNRFTQNDGSMVFPYGDLLTESVSNQQAHNGRAQLSYSGTGLTMIAGAEMRQNYRRGNTYTLYNYDDQVLTASTAFDYVTFYNTQPQGSARIPSPYISLSDIINRYLSYFANASYDWKKKYIFSGSLRWDASNLFGVKTNQKGTPLWSAGVRWKLSEEDFYSSELLPKVSLRLTYGFNGNVNTSASAYPILRYSTSVLTRTSLAHVRNPGEPQLRWEKTGIINGGIDFSVANNRLSGSVEYFVKKSKDLLGSPIVDPTVGIKPNDSQMQVLHNYASLKTQGIDLTIQSNNLTGSFNWKTDYIFNWLEDKVTHYETIGSTTITSFTSNTSNPPVIGRSLDAMFSLPWAGLDPDTGDPLVNQGGQLTRNYSAYLGALTVDDMVYSGVTFPRFQAGVRNTLSYKGLTLSFNLSLKAGYVFRRNTIAYSTLFDSGRGHIDFLDRWQMPGDELVTPVPSMPQGNVTNRDNIYGRSTLLVEKGDHVRWQDINLSYQIPHPMLWKFQGIKIFAFMGNVGMLWSANKKNLDPDYLSAALLPGKNYSLGLQLTF